MKVIVDLQPSEKMINAVTAAYKDFARFLEKAVKFYSEGASRKNEPSLHSRTVTDQTNACKPSLEYGC